MTVLKKGKIILGYYSFILFLYGTHAIRRGQEVTDPRRYPFIVSLRDVSAHFCGGNILSKRFVLTAAHCFYFRFGMDKAEAIDRLSVYARTLSRLEDPAALVYTMEDYYYFDSEFLSNIYKNDILILKTRQEIAIDGDRVKAVVLPTQYYLQEVPNTMVNAAGWGEYTLGGTLPRRLQEISLKVGSDQLCGMLDSYFALDQHFCTVDHPRRGTVHGDSGGPVIGPRGDLVGIISYRMPYINDLTWYEVHVKVDSFKTWIEFIMAYHG